MSSTTDATSFVAINYFKENMEEGVVDNPLSRGLLKIPICLPSPLKQMISSPIHQHLDSQTPHIEVLRHRKLYANEDRVASRRIDGSYNQGSIGFFYLL